MKNKKLIIFLITILSLFVLILTILTIGLISGKFMFNNFGFKPKTSNKLVLNEEYNNHFNSINIDSKEADINLKSTMGSSFKVKIYGDKELMEVEKNENLYIKTKEKSCIGFCFDISKIEVFIPENYSGKINIDNNFGDINIDKFENSDITIHGDSGDIFVRAGKTINADNNYGDTEIVFGKIVNIKESAGDVSVNNADDIIVKNSYGDIEIKKVNNYLNLSNDAGDIEIENLNINKNSVIKADYGDIEIEKTNKIFIDAKTDLGDIEINHNYNKSDIILKIKNDCGNIEIDN